MPILMRKKMVDVPAVFVCDCCGKHDDVGLHTFSINHTLGYDSPMDMTTVSAAICDTCLLVLLLERVRGVVFTRAGQPVQREEVVWAIGRYNKARP